MATQTESSAQLIRALGTWRQDFSVCLVSNMATQTNCYDCWRLMLGCSIYHCWRLTLGCSCVPGLMSDSMDSPCSCFKPMSNSQLLFPLSGSSSPWVFVLQSRLFVYSLHRMRTVLALVFSCKDVCVCMCECPYHCYRNTIFTKTHVEFVHPFILLQSTHILGGKNKVSLCEW